MAKNEPKAFGKDDIIFVKLETTQLPVFSIDQNGKHIKWGKNNNFPTEVLKLYNNNPIHGAIVKGKARYLSGLSIKPEQDLPIVQDFLKRANRKESWYQVKKKCDSDKVLYGGFDILVTTNIAAQPLSWQHIDTGKLRVHESGQGVFYSNEWDKKSGYSQIKKIYYPFYTEGYVGESILRYKDHSPSISSIEDSYPKSEYTSVILDISTLIEISKYFNSLVKNGFSAGHVITFFSGDVGDTAKADIIKRFQEQHQGADNAGKVAICFVGRDGKGVEIANVDSNNLDKQYQELSSALLQNIIAGHNVPGVLFKIKKDGSQLGNDRNEIDLAYELFISEYAKPEQEPFNTILKKFCLIKTGIDTNFSVEQFNPLNKELPLDNVNIINALNTISPQIVTDYIIEHYGLKLPEGVTKPAILPAQTPAVVEQNAVNESIKNLTGRQRQGLDAVLRKFNAGSYTKDQAIMHLKAFGFSEVDAIKYLGVTLSVMLESIKLSSDEKMNLFLEWVGQNTIEIGEGDELVSSEQVEFENRDDNLKFELSSHIKVRFDDDLQSDRKPGGWDFLKGLVGKKPPVKVKDVATGEALYENVVYTVYKYALRKGITGPMLLENSHDFCVKMVAATSGKNRLTFEKIDSYTNDFGENAWDFRGGWYGKSPICRHIFEGETYIKRKSV